MRLDGLEREIDGLRKEIDERERAIRDTLADVRAELVKETQARISEQAEVKRKLDEVAVGGLHLEFVGLLWLVIATIATSVPNGVAWFLHLASAYIP